MVAPLVKRIWIWCRNLLIFLFVSSILAVVVYKFVPVYYTPLMFIRMYEQHQDGKKMKLGHTWVPISKIAQPLVQAVIASEDNLFMEHNGFDVEQIQKARAEAEELRKRLAAAQSGANEVILLVKLAQENFNLAVEKLHVMKSTDGETADKLLAGTRKILETLIGRCG